MFTFLNYSILTVLISSYFFYSLYQKESQIFVFSIYAVKSKFHFCLLINFVLMIVVGIGKVVIRLFFGEIRLSEMLEVIDKIRMRFLSFLLLFLTFRPTIDFSKIFVVVVYHTMAILNLLAFKRCDYLISIHEKSVRLHCKIIFLFFVLGCLDYYFYTFLNAPINSKDILVSSGSKMTTNFDSLINYIFASEFIFLLIKLTAKFLKYLIDVTQISMNKHWNHKSLVFNLISFLRYTLKLVIEIKFCIILIRLGVVPIFFIIDVFNSSWNLIKLGYKIYDTFKINKYISSLPDFSFEQLEEAEEDKKADDLTCYICFDTITLGKKLNCGHTFHLRCLKEWVTTSVTCPLCKMPISTDGRKSGELNEMQDEYSPEEFDKSNRTKANPTNEFIQKINPDYRRFKLYNQILKMSNIIENEKTDLSSICAPTGAVSFSLPCQALYNRTVINEAKRLEIENYNRKILEIYENPLVALSKYEEFLAENK